MSTPTFDPDGLGLEPVPPVTSYSYVDPSGVDFTVVTVSWDPVATYEDGSAAAVVQYVVEVSTDGGSTYAGSVSVSGDVNIAELPPYLSGQTIWWRVRAIPLAGLASDPSAPIKIEMPGDEEPPPVATAPNVRSKLGILSVNWDGLFVDGALKPEDFVACDVHMSEAHGFTPTAATVVGSLRGPGTLQVTGQGIDNVRYFRLVARDLRGNQAAGSSETGCSVVGVTGPDIEANSVTANTIAAGALDAFQITSPAIRSSDPAVVGSRYELDSYGIHFYNQQGAATIDLDAATGKATITGRFQTAPPGIYPRVQLFSGTVQGTGESNAGLEFYTGTQAANGQTAGYIVSTGDLLEIGGSTKAGYSGSQGKVQVSQTAAQMVVSAPQVASAYNGQTSGNGQGIVQSTGMTVFQQVLANLNSAANGAKSYDLRSVLDGSSGKVQLIADANGKRAALALNGDQGLVTTGNVKVMTPLDGSSYVADLKVSAIDAVVATLRSKVTDTNAQTGVTWLTDNSKTVDTWSAVMAGISGTINGGNYTSSYQYFISYDRMVTFNFTLTFSTAPTTAGSFVLPNFLPAALVPSGGSTFGAGRVGTGTTVALIATRVESGSRTLAVFGTRTAAEAYTGTATYPIAKPS